jgi:prevent-host-death family protein
MTHILPITKARENLTKMVTNAQKNLDEYIITVNGSPAAVLISADEYDSWKETNEIVSDPQLMKNIQEGEKDIQKGNIYDLEDVKNELDIYNIYHVSDKTYRKGKKRT